MPDFEPTDRPLFDRIRERAYHLWEERGRPLGRDDEHWLEAEAEIVRGFPSADPEPRHTGAQSTY